MVMSIIWVVLMLLSLVFSFLNGQGPALSAAVLEGASAGVTLCLSIAGAICLWSGVSRVMEAVGLTEKLARRMSPLLHLLFPSTRTDSQAAQYLSANISANLLGLGNAATPLGIEATKCLQTHSRPGVASDEMCRLIVMNTASIQLIPSTVAAVRVSLGCTTPFDILPAVWVSSIVSVIMGLGAAWLFGKVSRHA